MSNMGDTLDQEKYIQERVDDQIEWYDRKSQSAQKWFKRFRLLEIILAAFIPFFAGFGDGEEWSIVLVGIFGASVAILAALLSLNQFHENWIEYRTTCESLKHEKYLFLTKSEPYNDDAPYDLFVQRIESLISKENSAWSQYTRKGVEASSPQNRK